jgi:hypothetical protein
MTSNQANSISIKDFLAGMNIHPKNRKTQYGMYFSPFRAETVPSFKVDYRKNLWYDFGSGEGGTMIDLAMRIYGCNFQQTVKKLESGFMPAFILPAKPIPQENKTILREVLQLKNKSLVGYLQQRGIYIEAALWNCVEVHYKTGDKHYYAIGFRNDAGGYELRNPYFKGSVSPKGITTYSIPTDNCMIFEGFMDFLSYLTLNHLVLPRIDTLVLNSAIHLEKAMDFLKRHTHVQSWLDNDNTGKSLLSEITNRHGNVEDMSMFYEPYKDLNEYLIKQLTIKNQ